MKARLLILGAALLVGGTANAEVLVVAGLPTEHVSYADLNLSSDAGQDNLRSRIRSAARDVCNYGEGFRPIKESMAVRTCYRGAIAEGYRQMAEVVAARDGSPNLAAASVLTIRAH